MDYVTITVKGGGGGGGVTHKPHIFVIFSYPHNFFFFAVCALHVKDSSIPMLSNVVFYDAKYVIYMYAFKKSVHQKIGIKNIKNATLPVANPHSQEVIATSEVHFHRKRISKYHFRKKIEVHRYNIL